ARGRGRRYTVYPDIVLLAFDVQRVHQADHRHLRGAVVGLAEIAVETGSGGGHDDAAVTLLAHDRPYRMAAIGGTGQVYGDHLVPVVVAHLDETLVAQDAGV